MAAFCASKSSFSVSRRLCASLSCAFLQLLFSFGELGLGGFELIGGILQFLLGGVKLLPAFPDAVLELGRKTVSAQLRTLVRHRLDRIFNRQNGIVIFIAESVNRGVRDKDPGFHKGRGWREPRN